MSGNRIAIVNSSSFGKIFPKHLEELKQIGEVESFTFDPAIDGRSLAQALKGFNMIIASVTPFFTKEFFEHKDELKIISRHGIGYNNVDLEAAKAHDTIVTIVPALVERDAVAEQNIANLMSVMRQVTQSNQAVVADCWENRASFVGHTLYNKTVGVIGVGNIGSCVVETLRHGFRCEVLGYDPYKSKFYMEQFGAKKVELDELLEKAEVICLCASLTDTSFHIINQETISKMKEGVYISNSARGALIDEEVLLESIKSGKISAYACDVLENEPGRAGHPFMTEKNILVTPHTGAYTQECLVAMGDKCVADIVSVLKGQLPERAIQAESQYIQL